MNAPDFRQIFRRIPLLAPLQADAFVITPLCGLTNSNFHLRYQHHDYVLRIPKKAGCDFIDRNLEAFNEDQVIKNGFAPEVIWRDNTGLSLSQCIRHSRSLTKADFNDDSIMIALIERLKTLHQSNIKFKGQTDIIGLLKYYSESAIRQNGHVSDDRLNMALSIHENIHRHDDRLVSSHNDLVLENLLIDDQRKLWLIDWEYSGLSSPYWDIATVCNSAQLEDTTRYELLGLYDSPIRHLRIEYLAGYQYILQLLTIGWLSACSSDAVEVEIDWLSRLEKSVITLN